MTTTEHPPRPTYFALRALVRAQGYRDGQARQIRTRKDFQPAWRRYYDAGLRAALKRESIIQIP